MTVATAERSRGSGYLDRPKSSSLADVLDIILDKGLVIDAYVRVSLVGIELLTIDLRVVVASVDTYLRFAEATNRLDLYQQGGRDIPELVEGMTQSGSKGKTQGAVSGIRDALSGRSRNQDQEQEQEQEQDEGRQREEEPQRRPRKRTQQRRSSDE